MLYRVTLQFVRVRHFPIHVLSSQYRSRVFILSPFLDLLICIHQTQCLVVHEYHWGTAKGQNVTFRVAYTLCVCISSRKVIGKRSHLDCWFVSRMLTYICLKTNSTINTDDSVISHTVGAARSFMYQGRKYSFAFSCMYMRMLHVAIHTLIFVN